MTIWGREDNQFRSSAIMVHLGPPTKIAEMVQSVGSWKPNKELPVKSKDCEHEWNENTVTNYTICYFCGILTTDTSRLNCPKCQLTTCALCARNYLDKTVNVKRKQPQKQEEEKNFNSNSNEVNLLKELLKEKTEQVQQMIRDQAKEYYEEKAAMQKKEEIWQLKESSLVRDISDALKIIDQLRIEKEELGELIIEKKRLEEQKDEEIRKLKAQLQKKEEEAEVQFPKEEFPPLGNTHVARPCVETEFDIPNCKAFGTTAIIDTGASACCINKKVIPEEALEPLNQTVVFNGLNSNSNGIEMLIGANFLRSMKGGIRIEGDEITIYKRSLNSRLLIKLVIAEIAELDVNVKKNSRDNESIYFNQEGSRVFQDSFKLSLIGLKSRDTLEKEPYQAWGNRSVGMCQNGYHQSRCYNRRQAIKHVTPEQWRSVQKTGGGSSKVPQYLSEEYEDHLRRSHEDFQPLPRIFTKTIFTIEEPGAMFNLSSLKANQSSIRMDKSDAMGSVALECNLQQQKESTTKKPEESSSNWKPWHKDWDAITSNYSNDDDNKNHYNRKGFLEDDERSDDSIFIVDPGWDDYSLQAIKSNRPVPLCPEARRARIRLNLFSKIALKNYKSISEKQKELESRVQNCQEKLESCEELLRKTQSETRKSLQQISTEIQQSKPLTKREVLNLVQEIAEQPKLVEKEVLRLTEDLNQKIQKVEHLLHEIKKLITG
ncbi:RNA-directed DNA polymerase [Tanacetum coccineum]